jgi:hypothetical protein
MFMLCVAVEHVEVPVEIHDPIMAAHLSAMAQVQYAHAQAMVSWDIFFSFFTTGQLLPLSHVQTRVFSLG